MGNIWAAIGRGKRKNRSVVLRHHCTASQCTASLLYRVTSVQHHSVQRHQCTASQCTVSLLYSFVFDLWQQVLFCSLGLPQTPGLLALLFWTPGLWPQTISPGWWQVFHYRKLWYYMQQELCRSLHGGLCDSLVWFYSTILTIRAEFVSPIDESGIQLLPSVYAVDLDMLSVL